MGRYSLAGYTIRARINDQYAQLDSVYVDSNVIDMFFVFQNYFNDRNALPSHDPNRKRLLKVANFEQRNRQLFGIIETGEYGYETELYNVDTGNISYRRSIEDAEMLPFYFLIYLPRNANEGILLLQRFKQFGIRTIFEKDINRYIKDLGYHLKLEINPLVPRQLIEQYLNGRIVRLRFIRFGWPSEIADAYDNQGHCEEEGCTELVISAKKKGHIPVVERIRDFFCGRRGVTDLLELHNFDYNNVKVEIDLNGNKRTIDLSNLNKVRAYYDITNEIEVGSDGHPRFESINRIAQSMLRDLRELIYGDYYD